MAGIKFTPEQIAELEQLSCVERITPKMLIFTQEFKRFAVNQTKQGKTIYQLVKDAGINPKLFAGSYLYIQLKAWRKQDLSAPPKPKGPPKGSKPELDPKDMTIGQLRAKLALAEAENEFLKKSSPWIRLIE